MANGCHGCHPVHREARSQQLFFSDETYFLDRRPFLGYRYSLQEYVPSEQSPTGAPESRTLISGQALSEVSHGGIAVVETERSSTGNGISLIPDATSASISLIPQFPKEHLAGGKIALLPELSEMYELLMKRLQLVNSSAPVNEAFLESRRSVIMIVLGKRLGGLLGLTTTQEGRCRCQAAADYLPILHAFTPKATLFAGASGHQREGEVFTARIKELLNERQFNWESSIKLFTEPYATNTFENILFSRAEVFRLFNPPPPRLWVVCSSDNHLGSLLLKDQALPPQVTELGLLRQDESDATAILPASYPYRASGDPGLDWICRAIDAAFMAAPLQANLYGIKNGVPDWNNSTEKAWKKRKRPMLKLNKIYENPADLLKTLINYLKLLRDNAPLTEYQPETRCAYLVTEVRKNIESVIGPLGKIHSDLERVIGLENGNAFDDWHGVDLDHALLWINRLIARVRWFADFEASDADRDKVRQHY